MAGGGAPRGIRGQSLRYDWSWPAVPRQRFHAQWVARWHTPEIGSEFTLHPAPTVPPRLSACTDRWGHYTPRSWSLDCAVARAGGLRRGSAFMRDGWLGGTPRKCNPRSRCTLRPHCRLSAQRRPATAGCCAITQMGGMTIVTKSRRCRLAVPVDPILVCRP